MQGHDGAPSVSRRAVLGSVAGLTVGTRVASATGTPTLSVLTRNLYHGVNLLRLRDVDTADELRAVAGELLREAERHPYDARLAGIANEIDRELPDVVCVQEGVRARRRPVDESDGDDSNGDDPDGDDSTTAEWTAVVDLLSGLETSLAERGLDYSVAASTVSTEGQLVAENDDGAYDLAVADRGAVLVRDGLETDETRTGTYEAGISYSLPGVDRTIRLERGYCFVDVTVAGRPVTVATTHLERVSAAVRRLQAEELLGLVPDHGPVVVAGDLNSGPGGSMETYDRLRTRFDDAWSARRDATGFTCCQPASLTNDEPGLDRRVDAVLFDGPMRATAALRVGDDPENRVDVERDGETVTMWPSNHAGVLARFAAEWSPATATPTTTATPTATSTLTSRPESTTTATVSTADDGARTNTPSPTDEPGVPDSSPNGARRSESEAEGPGFGVATAIGAVGFVALRRLGVRGHRDRE